MRIAHVLRRLSFDDWGGTEQVVWNIAMAQRALGHDVRLFATTALCPVRDELRDGLRISRFPPVYPWWPMPGALAAQLDRKGGNPFVPGLGKALREWTPDVVHSHAMARIAELCLRTPPVAKRVISLHGGGANVPEEEARSLKAPTRGRFPWGKIVDKAMGWARRVPEDFDGIVCVGEDEYRHYASIHPHAMYLPNGVDVKLYSAAARRSRHSLASDPVLLCVARIDRQKNQMMLVDLLSRHPELRVRLAGPVTQPDYKDEIAARAARSGVSDRLFFTGALKPGSPELVSEYAAASAFVLPSRHEPFGIAVLEAWAAGLPVIASDIGGLGRLMAAHPGAALPFAPGDCDALDSAYLRLRDCEGLAASLSSAGRSAASQYDWQALAGRLLSFYAQV